jgi:hypothetical protein
MSPSAEQLDPGSPARTGNADPGASPRPAVPQQAVSPESSPDGAVGQAASDEAAGDPSPGGEQAGDDQQTVEELAPTTLEAWLERLSRVARAAGSGTLELAVSNPLEFGAVALLGIGGAAWPPVWLVGVALAMPSRAWDLRDKWTGLVGPVLLAILGTTAVLMLGGQHGSIGAYVYEAWLSAGRIGRAASLLGAAYLLRRLIRGRREPRQPRFDVPRRRV